MSRLNPFRRKIIAAKSAVFPILSGKDDFVLVSWGKVHSFCEKSRNYLATPLTLLQRGLLWRPLRLPAARAGRFQPQLF
ncbi:MAG: hypothetical protein R3C14_11225 [Caldilineaceae bacterium]